MKLPCELSGSSEQQSLDSATNCVRGIGQITTQKMDWVIHKDDVLLLGAKLGIVGSWNRIN